MLLIRLNRQAATTVGCCVPSMGPGLLRSRIERGEPAPDVLGPPGLRGILEEALVCGARLRGLAGQRLRARQVEQGFLEEELPGAEAARGHVVRGHRAGIVLLRLPRVADPGGAQRAEAAARALGERDLVGRPRRRVVAGLVLEIAELVGGLARRGRPAVLGQNGLEHADGLLASLRGGQRALALLDRLGGARQRRLGAGLFGAQPEPARRPHETEGHDHAGDLERQAPAAGLEELDQVAHRWRSSAGSPVSGRSIQISPLTAAPSAAEKLPVLSVPVSTPVGRISTRVAAERLPRTVPPTTIARALILASTSAPSPTSTRPVTLMSPSKRPAMWKSPSPATSPLKVSPAPRPAGSPRASRWAARSAASESASPPPPRPRYRRVRASAPTRSVSTRSGSAARRPPGRPPRDAGRDRSRRAGGRSR